MYQDLYSDDVKRQANIVRIFSNILEERESILENNNTSGNRLDPATLGVQ